MTLEALSDLASDSAEPALFSHPRGLTILFLTEMWERFSYYGMRALLVLYMVKYLLQPEHVTNVLGFGALRTALESIYGPLDIQPMSSQIYGLYTALVYLTPILGGAIADRWFGQRRTAVVGMALMAAGHFLMAIESMFLVALFLIILGVGAFKPNTTAQVGGLYAKGDHRRDRGYSVFYVGINLGAFIAPLICGSLGELAGWHWGFGAAGVGILCGMVFYLWGLRYLPPDQRSVATTTVERRALDSNEWRRVIALCLLCLLNIFFWATYEQQGNTIALWADADVDRSIDLFGWVGTFPTTWVQSINPAMIFLFTPFITLFWARQARNDREPSSVSKQALGLLLCGAAFLVLAFATRSGDGAGKVSWLWLIAHFTLLTTGELYLSPVGLSLVSKTAPMRIGSMMMGVWFLSYCGGDYLSGYLGSYWERMPHASFFALMAAIAVVAGAAVWIVGKPMERAMVEVETPV